MTVKELRQKGFVIKVRHNRNSNYDFFDRIDSVSSRGGNTEVAIYEPFPRNHDSSDILVSSGQSFCCPIDNYNKKLGVTIALGRALKGITI